AITQRWHNSGGAQGLLGQPQGEVQRDPNGVLRQDYQTTITGGGYGAVSVPPSVTIDTPMCNPHAKTENQTRMPVKASIFASSSTGVHYVVGEIREKYLQAGGPEKFGYPVTDEIPTPDGLGLMTKFERGTIFWYPGRSAEIGEPIPPPIVAPK